MNVWQKQKNALAAMMMAVSLLLSSCESNQKVLPSEAATVEETTPTFSPIVETIAPTVVPTSTPEITKTPDPTATPITDGMTYEQKNSIGMLNYLTMITQEINSSSSSRLYLENAYSLLLNNTNPDAVDQQTEMQLKEILEGLKDYRMIAVKRDRLEYIYEKNKARAIRASVPNPIGLLSSTASFNWPAMIASVTYMAVDSVSSYQNAMNETEMQYLQDGWSLDDADHEILHRMRSNAFTYMIDMANAYNLPGDLVLTEKAVDDFVEWKREKNIVRRIQLLEANQKIYLGFGPYWLTLAESYYLNQDYTKCIEAISKYEALNIRIFRQDFELARTLPSAYYSAMNVLDGDAFIRTAIHYLELIETNAAYEDWALRYFVAQGYIDLYQRTGDNSFLQKAYDLALNNVTNLVSYQQRINGEYIADIKKTDVPKGTPEGKKKEIEQMNKQAEEARKTALPPILEPLTLNCDLLFSIAEVLGIAPSEQAKIESILHHNNEPLFLNPIVDNRYWFSERKGPELSDIAFEFRDGTITLPAQFVTDSTKITLRVSSTDAEDVVIDDWIVTKVERKDKNDISTFVASYTSKTASKYGFKKGDMLSFSVVPEENNTTEILRFTLFAREKHTWYRKFYLDFERPTVATGED